MKLFEIANEYERLLDDIYDKDTGEVNLNAVETLDSLEVEAKEKGIAIATYIKNIDADRKAIEEAKKAMAERETALDNRVKYLTQYLQLNMEKFGITELSCPYFVVKLKKNPASVDDYNPSLIPDEYKRTVTEVKLDKRKILEDLKQGVVIPGAAIKQSNRLDIR